MRILIVCPYNWNRHGGVKTHITDSANALINLGHHVVVLSPAQGNCELPEGWELVTPKAPHPRTGALLPIQVGITLPFGGTQIDVTWMNGTTKEDVSHFLAWFSPDVIHFHTPWTPFMSIQLVQMAAELRNNRIIEARFVATFHDTPSGSGFGKVLGDYVMPLVARYFMRAFNEVISVSEPQSRYLTRFTPANVHVIPNGIHPPVRATSSIYPSTWLQQQPYLLFLGRLEQRKGLMDAIEVYWMLSSRFKELSLIVAGDGPQRPQAEALVAKLGLQGVRFTGSVTDVEKWELMAHAKLYLAPALFGESFGIVLLEAMSVGTPVVGYANEGYKRVISGNFDAQFVEPGRTQELAAVISELLDDDCTREGLSARGIDFAGRFKWDTLIHRLLEVYARSHSG
jgi:phosphatidylinositol alpha-mannosyltransferase